MIEKKNKMLFVGMMCMASVALVAQNGTGNGYEMKKQSINDGLLRIEKDTNQILDNPSVVVKAPLKRDTRLTIRKDLKLQLMSAIDGFVKQINELQESCDDYFVQGAAGGLVSSDFIRDFVQEQSNEITQLLQDLKQKLNRMSGTLVFGEFESLKGTVQELLASISQMTSMLLLTIEDAIAAKQGVQK